MIQLTKAGLAGVADLQELSAQFERTNAFRLPGLIHPDLFGMISSRLEDSAWDLHVDGDIARESVPADVVPANVLNFAVNTTEFIDFIQKLTGLDIKYFGGRIYRMSPGGDHYDTWHSDIGNSKRRLLGMSINLGNRPYTGGVFKLRDKQTRHPICELPNTGRGDAIFFRISPTLQHMVTAVGGSEPKTAFAGWFRSGDLGYYSFLKPINRELSKPTSEEMPT